ncbi:MAG: exosortase-associated EpsI family protein [Verrucomicrobiota bacterium]
MNSRPQKILIGGLLAAAALALAWDLVPLSDAQNRVARLDSAGLGFASREMTLNETEKSIFGAAQVVKRVYRAGRENLVVVIIDGTHNRHAVHDPTYCFRGAGWTIAGERPLTLPGGTGRILSLHKGSETREVVFWFSDGRDRHATVTRCWWQTSLRRLTFGASSPATVLVLVQPLESSRFNWERLPSQLPGLFEF